MALIICDGHTGMMRERSRLQWPLVFPPPWKTRREKSRVVFVLPAASSPPPPCRSWLPADISIDDLAEMAADDGDQVYVKDLATGETYSIGELRRKQVRRSSLREREREREADV